MKKSSFLLLSLCLVLISSTSRALSTQTLKFYSPTSVTFSLVQSQPKPMDTLTLGLGLNYGLRPLEIGNSNNNNRVQGVVDNLFTMDFTGAYSFSDKAALGIGIPVHITNNVQNINSTTMETPISLGDIMISGLFNVIEPDSNRANFGLGVMPFVTFPTGVEENFVGDDGLMGGFILAGDFDLNGHTIIANLGTRLRKTEDLLNLSVASEFLYGLGYHHVLIPESNLDGFIEASGSTVIKDFFQYENSSPFEARVGVTKGFLPDNQLKATFGAGVGVGNGYGTPDLRAIVKLAYDHILPRTKIVKVIEQVPVRMQKVEKELKELTIYYPTDGDQVDPFYDEKIAGIARILQDNPDLGPLYIVGHTDDVHSDVYNQKLSESRARKAYNSIVAKGLNPKQIVVMGFGEKYPVVPNTTEENRALNRRTLFTFVKPAQLTEASPLYQDASAAKGKKNDSYTNVLKTKEPEAAAQDQLETDQ